jgi:hypothetical protein
VHLVFVSAHTGGGTSDSIKNEEADIEANRAGGSYHNHSWYRSGFTWRGREGVSLVLEAVEIPGLS